MVNEKDDFYKKGVAENEVKAFSNAINRPIDLEETNLVQISATDGKTILINPKSKIIKSSEDIHTMLNHEQAHVLFQSNQFIPEALERAYPEMSMEAIKTVYNILEDFRIESNWVNIFPGSRRGYDTIKKDRLFNEVPQNPIEVLGCIRCGREDLIEKSSPEMRKLAEKFSPKIKELAGKNYVATFVVESEILKDIHDWYKKQPFRVKSAKNAAEASKEEIPEDPEYQKGYDDGFNAGVKDYIKKVGKENFKGRVVKSTGGISVKKINKSSKRYKEGYEDGYEIGVKGNEEQENSQQNEEQQKRRGWNPAHWQNNDGNQQKGNEEEEAEESSEASEGLTEKQIKEKMSEAAKSYEEKDGLTKSEEEVERKPPNLSKSEVDDTLVEESIIDAEGKPMEISEGKRERIMNNSEAQEANTSMETKAATGYNEKAGVIDKDIFKEMDEIRAKRLHIPTIPPSPIMSVKRVLKEINQKEEEIEAEEGKKMNISKAIQKIINPESNAKPFKRNIGKESTDFWVLLDLSGSMKDARLQMCKNAMASIYDSIKATRNPIGIRMFGFTSVPEEMGKTPLVFEIDRKRLNSLQTGLYTPTADAVSYVTSKFKKEGVAFKNLIILTDGFPDNGIPKNFEAYALKTEREIKKARSEGINVFTLFIGSDKKELEELKTEYGVDVPKTFGSKNMIAVKNLDDVDRELTYFFKKEILKKLEA